MTPHPTRRVFVRAWKVRVHTLTRPHGTIGATYPIINGVRFIPVNLSPLLKVALPLRNAFPPVPTFLVTHP